MASLAKIATILLVVAGVCIGIYLRYRLWYQGAMQHEERRHRRSGLQGFLKKID